MMTQVKMSPKVLLVEGKDDLYFFEALIRNCGLEDVGVEEVGGKDKFPTELQSFLLTYGEHVQSLAIVRDADRNAFAAFQSVCDLLKKVGEPFPAAPRQFGSSGKRRIGYSSCPATRTRGCWKIYVY